MKKDNWRIASFLSTLVLVFASVTFSADGAVDVNEIFKVGDQREIEVALPKKDFIGAPPMPVAYPAGRRGVPKWDEDFSKRYVRITVLDKRKLKESTRVALQLDEIDPNGAVVMDHSRRGPSRPRRLYYACLDIRSSGCKIVGSIEPVKKDKWGNEPDFGNGVLNRGHYYGIPFPLMLTCPPALSPDRSLKENGWMRGDNGVVYTESTKVVDGRRVRVALLRKVYPSMKVNLKDSRYYSDKDKTLSKEAKADSIKVIISAQEIQMWKTSTDWLWETMERTDGKGHITMRCRRLK